MGRRVRPARGAISLLTCTLAVPTVSGILYGAPDFHSREALLPYLAVGVALGVAHVVLRPLLRLITAPLGCLTFGLSGTVIDVGLIYLSARVLPAFQVPSLLYALLTAILINAICAFAAGRR